MFSGKTWRWSVGGAYFAPDSSFKAAIGEVGASPSVIRGTWRVGDGGELCLKARWGEQASASEEETCFYHWEHEGSILQKKASSGSWYTFRSSPPKEDDEVTKLSPGDHVSTSTANPA
jgi:hypothetical protein